MQSHILPDGYIGAVVVVFGETNGLEIDEGSNPVEFHIPPDGVLRLSNTGPRRSYAADFYYSTQSGPQKRLAFKASPDEFQVFGLSIGGYEDSEVSWISYLVGIPNARDDWLSVRAKKVTSAVPPQEPTHVPSTPSADDDLK